jgi:hypothetical protein
VTVTHVVQCGLADRVVVYSQHLDHLLHLTEHLGQGDPVGLQLELDFGVVALLGVDSIQTTCFTCNHIFLLPLTLLIAVMSKKSLPATTGISGPTKLRVLLNL